MKRITLALIMIIILSVCMFLFCGAAMAETGGTDGNITWTLSDEGVLTISGNGPMNNYSAREVDGVYITTAPWGIDPISVVICDGVTSVGNYAFYGCGSLTSIIIPDSVTSIGSGALASCSGLTSVTIPDGVTSIGYGAFADCSGLTSVSISGSVTSISDSTFYSCSSLSSVAIPDGVTSIGPAAFGWCTGLKSVTIPDSVTSIGNDAFYFCSSLSSVAIPDGVTSIGDNTFYNCSSLTSVTIPDGVTSIGSYAFDYCASLPDITLPDSVTSIGNYTFVGCNSLSRIWWPTLAEVTLGDFALGYRPESITLYCYEFSPLETTATNVGVNVSLIDDFDPQNDIEITVPSTPEVEAGSSILLTCSIFPDLPEAVIRYSSDNPAVGTVDDSGVFTAVAPGTVNITVYANNASRTFPVTVVRPQVHAISLSLADVWVVAKTDSPTSLTVEPADADLNLTWATGSATYATVATDGTVTGKAVGETTITVTDSISGLSATAAVHTCYPVTAVAFADEALSLPVGQERQLTANVTMRTQSCVNHLVIFTSSDETVATVSADGVVHALSNGTAMITATAVNDAGVSASIPVTVRAPLSPTFPASLTIIEDEAFAGTPFEAVVIPDTVTSIGSRAFAGCQNLTYVYIPASVTSVAPDAFTDCPDVIIEREGE